MAVFQNVFNFFLPSQRRSRAAGGGGAPKVDSATQRLLEGIDGVLEPFNAPDYLTEYLEEDLKKAFQIKGPARPVYEPGRVPSIEFNLLDLITDPVTTAWETVKKPFEAKFSDLLYTPDDFISAVDGAVWEYLYQKGWIDAAGGEVVPYSLRHVVNLWRGTLGKDKPRVLRHLAAQALRDNPGMVLMKAHRIEMHYMDEFGKRRDPSLWKESRRFRALKAEARRFEEKLSASLREAEKWKEEGDKLARAGKIDQAREAWGKADAAWRRAEGVGKIWSEGFKDVRGAVSREFERLSRRGGPLYNSPEARFVRFWEGRNLHYATLQFLGAYRRGGFWEVVKVYGWKKLTDKFKDYYYASKLNYTLNALAQKVGVTKLLSKLMSAQTFVRRLRAQFWVKQGLKKVGGWLIIKLRLGALFGGVAGSILPGIGNVAGVIIGAVVTFVGEVILEKLGGALKLVGYVLAGVIGFFVLFAIAIITLFSIILSDKPYPWERAAAAIDCDQTATATDACVRPRDEVKGIADRWGAAVNPGENHVKECYHDVIAKAQAAGVRPDFAMAIWLNESNASNYKLYERLGEEPQDFGVPALAGRGFTAQITAFFSYIANHPFNYPQCFKGRSPMEAFMIIYRVGNCDSSGAIDTGMKYLADIRDNAFKFVSKCEWPDYPMNIRR